MTTPRVTEMPLRMEPVTPDPFIERLPAERTRRSERERHLDRVRRIMAAGRNGRTARGT